MLSPGSSASLQVRGGVRTSACAHRGLFYYDTSVELLIILFFAKCDFFPLYFTPSCTCDSAGVSWRQSDRCRFCHDCWETSSDGAEQSESIGFNFLALLQCKAEEQDCECGCWVQWHFADSRGTNPSRLRPVPALRPGGMR